MKINKKMKVAIVVFVVGDRYIKSFEAKFKKTLQYYCQKHQYDLIILTEPIRYENNFDRKKFFWQRLLIADKFKDYDFVISLDSDIYVNPHSPPLPLKDIPEGKVGCVNERKYLGNYEWREYIQSRHGWEKTGKDWYKLSGEDKDYNDHINGGLVIYQPKYHAKMMVDLYDNNIINYLKYHQDDQSILSSYLIDNNLIYWLDERFNHIWFFWKELFYPFFNNLPVEFKKVAVINFIKLNYFTHFTSGTDIEFIP
jgi:hypothetical protein